MKSITEQEFEEKAKLLKKTDKKAETLESKNLSDEELDNVAGGFWKKKGYAKGWWIECPSCGCNVHEGIDVWEDQSSHISMFFCRMCGVLWGLDRDGNIWEP